MSPKIIIIIILIIIIIIIIIRIIRAGTTLVSNSSFLMRIQNVLIFGFGFQLKLKELLTSIVPARIILIILIIIINPFHLNRLLIIEVLGETCIIRIIIQIIITRAGTPHVSHSFNFNWKPKCIDPKIQYILDSSLSVRNY